MANITIKTTTEFLDRAYENACDIWKKELIKEVPYLKEKHSILYKRGDKFKNEKESYIISTFTQGSKKYGMLVDLSDGNRFTEPAEIGDLMNITIKEFLKITAGNPFTKIIEK